MQLHIRSLDCPGISVSCQSTNCSWPHFFHNRRWGFCTGPSRAVFWRKVSFIVGFIIFSTELYLNMFFRNISGEKETDDSIKLFARLFSSFKHIDTLVLDSISMFSVIRAALGNIKVNKLEIRNTWCNSVLE